MKRIILMFLLLVSASFNAAAEYRNLTMVCTIKPVCLLLREVVGDQAEVIQLLPDNADLHHYSFRPSDLKKLAKAKVIVRASADLERFLSPLLDDSNKMVITLSDAPNLHYLPLPLSHQHAHETEEEHHEHSSEEHEEVDPHFWMNPENAEKIVDYIVRRLMKFDAERTKVYQLNGLSFYEKLRATDKQIHLLFANDQHQPYLTFHQGLQYFEHYYGLEKPEVISLHEGLSPGVKTIRRLKKEIRHTQSHCLITQPEASQSLVRLLTEGMSMNVVMLDAVGSALPREQNSYTGLLMFTAQKLHQCLQK